MKARHANESKRGVALIVVLGFLSVIVLLGVSFAVMMRTERLAARNYADGVRAKHLVRVGITRAIADINADLTANNLLAPDWQVFESINTPPTTNRCKDLLNNLNHVPYVLRGTAQNIGNQAQWINIADPEQSSVILGRYAYAALDCTGFIDANIPDGLARGTNTVPAALKLTRVPEFSGAGLSVDRFFDERDTYYVEFENLHELVAVVTSNQGDRLMKAPIQNFFTYSRALPEGRWSGGGVTDKIDLNAAAVNGDWGTIQSALTSANVPNANKVVLNLRDYVDADLIPNGGGAGNYVNDFMTEPVPMINEIVVSNVVKTTPGVNPGDPITYENTLYVVVETWYPFPQTAAGIPSFKVRIPQDIRVTQFPAGPALPGTTTIPAPAAPAWTPQAYSFKRHDFQLPGGSVSIAGPLPNPMGWQVNLDGIEVVLDADSTVVDRVPALPDSRFQLLHNTTQPSAQPRGSSCVDPRINWRATDWRQGSTISMAGQNLPAPAPTNTSINVGEGPSEMYVRNSSPSNVYELGFLSVGNPWKTVALYDNPAAGTVLHPVLDYFRIGPAPTNAVKGRVSLNTKHVDVLRAAFYHAPIKKYPDENGAQQVTWDTALELARVLTNNHHRNISEIGKVGPAMVTYEPTWSDAKREAVIGNTYPLTTVRQNMFTLFVAAQGVQDANGDRVVERSEIVSEQRAVAILWRDPYPPGSPHHEYPYVRFFKWLYE